MVHSDDALGNVPEDIPEKSKIVLVWGRDDVLTRSFESFFAGNQGWEVIRFSDKQDEDFLVRKVQELNPDVVILYQGNRADPTELPGRLLQERKGLKVITFSLENNFMEVYQIHKVEVHEAADLLAILEG